MKVLVATGLYPPEIGGPATYAVLLESLLPEKAIAVEVVPFLKVRRYPKIIRHVLYAYLLWNKSKTSDIMYALDPISVGLPALLIARIRRIPFLIRLGGDYAWEQGVGRFGITETLDQFISKKSRRPILVSIFALLQSWVTKQATYVVAPSKYLKSIIASWGVTSERIVVINSAVSPQVITETKEAIRTRLCTSYPSIVSAGRLVPWKGFSVLIDVIATLKERYPDISLIIAGDGTELSALTAKVKTLELEKNINFIGRATKEDLGATIKAADIFVLNTAYEGLSHQLIEVMDIGTPIVTTTVGGNPELINDSSIGLLVEFNNHQALVAALLLLLEDETMRSTMAKAAQVRARDFSESIMIEKIETLLRNVYESESR